jgi:hypothetical protein
MEQESQSGGYSDDNEYSVFPEDKLILDIKRHVVQLEGMVLFAILFLAVLWLQSIVASVVSEQLALILPFTMLASLPLFVRVTNPEDTARAVLKGASTGIGVGGSIGAGIAGTLTGGLGAPAGGLLGGLIGGIVGAIAGPWLDGQRKKVLTQGEAQEWLVKRRKKYPDLSLDRIVAATKYPSDPQSKCHVFMFSSDGFPKCTREDLEKFLKSRCWRYSESGTPV